MGHTGAPNKTLIASIHDVSPRFSDEIELLLDQLVPHLGGPRLAMLVVADYWNSAPIAADVEFQRRLRAWSDAGIEIFVHGYSHRDEAQYRNPRDAFKARYMTAGEGEFLGLDQATALARMTLAKTIIEDITGAATTGFIAPAWLYGDGAMAALPEAGFAIAEDHMHVWNAQTGATMARGPVLTWASRSRTRIAMSLAFARAARHAFRPIRHVRLAVHPGDVRVPSLVDSIDGALRILLRGRKVGRYADLVDPHAATLSPDDTNPR